jgi:hypothetical protein
MGIMQAVPPKLGGYLVRLNPTTPFGLRLTEIFQEAPMCQQWFSVFGLVLDVTGFLLIAFEWRHVFWREHERRIYELQHDYERYGAVLEGREYEDPRRG